MAGPVKHSFLKISLSVIGIIVGLGILASLSPSARSEKSPPPDTSTKNDDGRLIIKTDDLILSRDYAANEVAAQNRYGGKTLWVKGFVTGITLDFMNHPVIEMRGVNEYLVTQAQFDDSAKDDLGKLHKGDLVTMQCTEITEVVSAPMLSDCALMPNSTK